MSFLFFPLALSFVLGSCSPLPLSERAFVSLKLGGGDSFFDDFEKNDGTRSTEYYYEGDISLSTDWALSGIWSLKLKALGKVEFAIAPKAPAMLGFSSKRFWNLNVRVDGAQCWSSLMYDWGDYYTMYFEIPAGAHSIEIATDGDALYLDDVSCFYMSSAATPAANELRFVDPVFAWPAVPEAEAYGFQLSRNSDMTDPLVDLNALNEPSYTGSSVLDSGEWYWRTRIKARGSWATWSPVRHFSKLNTTLSDRVADLTWTPDKETLYGSVLDIDGGMDGGYSIEVRLDFGKLAGTFSEPCLLKYAVPSDWVGWVYVDDVFAGQDLWLSASPSWRQGFAPIPSAGRHEVKFRFFNESSFRLSSLEVVPYVAAVDESFDSGVLASSSYLLLGHGYAVVTAEEAHSGARSLLLLGNSYGESLVLPVRLDTPATLSFYAKNNATAGNSYLSVYDNYNLNTPYYLEMGWKKFSIPLTAGFHLLRFDYPSYDSSFDFRAYIDDITFD